MSSPTVLVTGCAGYIGSVLVGDLLESGCQVIGVDCFAYHNACGVMPHIGKHRFEFHYGLVEDEQLMKPLANRADVIIPLAALVGAPICERFQSLAKCTNLDAVRMLVGLCSPAQRILYPNTNSGYGSTDGVKPCTEKDPMNPISVYGVTKCEAEKAVLDHPNSAVLRLATVFGVSPRMRFDLMVNDFTQKLSRLRWQPCATPTPRLEIFEPHFKRNFVHVRDVSRAFRFLMGRQWLTGPFNLGLPTANLTKWELATRVCDVIGLSHQAVSVGVGIDPDRRNYLVSNEKIMKAGFFFEHELEHGINEVSLLCKILHSGLSNDEMAEQLNTMRNA